MTFTADSTLADVALGVAATLTRHGIRAVLTGGACVSIHTDGLYVSKDADFVIQSPLAGLQGLIDEALATVGFLRQQDRYVHPLTAFFVEFPPGPLSIGGDLDIHPVALKVAGSTALILSATDSCRDRLCAFYFWDDRQSLDLAVTIARRNPVDLDLIRRWSRAEGAAQKYQEFRRHIARRSRRG